MERKQIANVVVPAAAVAALIALVALVIVVGGSDDPKAPTGETTVPVAAVTSAAGMSGSIPPTDGPEWKDIGDGLKILDVKEGDGPPIFAGGAATAHYTGWLTNGTVFDSTVRKGEPYSFSLDQMIPGWKLGMPGMRPGGIRRLYIPAFLAYGSRGRPGIPADSPLVFEVKLISSP